MRWDASETGAARTVGVFGRGHGAGVLDALLSVGEGGGQGREDGEGEAGHVAVLRAFGYEEQS